MKLLQKKGSSMAAMFTAVIIACLGLAQQSEAAGFDRFGEWWDKEGVYETTDNYFCKLNSAGDFESRFASGAIDAWADIEFGVNLSGSYAVGIGPAPGHVGGYISIFCDNPFYWLTKSDQEPYVYDDVNTFGLTQAKQVHELLLERMMVVLQSNGVFPGVWDFKKDGDGNILSLRYTVEGPSVTPVVIDIKPGSAENTVNLGSKGVTKVAILGSDDFNATEVDPTTVELADATVRVKGNGQPLTTIQDTNGDGFLDLVLHVDTEGFTLTDGDVSAELTGSTFGGDDIFGEDMVRVVP